MNRRESIVALLAMAAASGSFTIRAQRAERRPYRIAPVPDFPLGAADPMVKILEQTLRESGRIEGRDYVILRSGVFYGPDTKLALDRALDAKPDLIMVMNLGYAVDAHRRTKTIPIVMWISGFPVEGGVAESLARPGKNVTGMTIYAGGEYFGKLVSLVHEAKPSIKRIGAIMSYVPPFHPRAEADHIIQGMRDAAASLGLDLRVFEFARSEQIDDALAWVVEQGVEALVLTTDASTWPVRQKIMQFALAQRLPTITDSYWDDLEPKPLLSYRARFDLLMRQAAGYVIRILWEGAKPGDLAIQLPANFKFVVNLKTAKAIGVTIPQSMLLLADQVFQ